MTETALDVGGGSLRLVRNRPEQPPQLLLLHGVLRDWRTYYSILPLLQSELSIAALDFRGHGGSTARAPYFVIDYVSDALHVIRSFNEPCVVHGHSLGAMVALAAASAEPARVKGLVLEDPPFSTMGTRLPTLPLLRYFQGVEACLLANASADAESMYQAFSEIVVGQTEDGRPILVRDQRDETSRRFSAECLTRVDPAVLQPITSGCWLEGYDLARFLDQVRCPVEVLQADWQCGGMLKRRGSKARHAKAGGPLSAALLPWSRTQHSLGAARRRHRHAYGLFCDLIRSPLIAQGKEASPEADAALGMKGNRERRPQRGRSLERRRSSQTFAALAKAKLQEENER